MRTETGESGTPALLGAVRLDAVAVSVSLAAAEPGYEGWMWSVTLAVVDDDPPTVSEVVLLPGAEALGTPAWVPWEERLTPGDLGPGDLLPPPPDDFRLVPGYLQSDDPEVERLAAEIGLGRELVMSRDGRLDLADRLVAGDFSPASDMALQAPALCGTCGFYLPLAGSLGTAFGACGNEYSPADGRVVNAAFGCGAHSSVAPPPPRGLATETVLDELVLEVHAHPAPEIVELASESDLEPVFESELDTELEPEVEPESPPVTIALVEKAERPDFD